VIIQPQATVWRRPWGRPICQQRTRAAKKAQARFNIDIYARATAGIKRRGRGIRGGWRVDKKNEKRMVSRPPHQQIQNDS
jgi:hypothetical protein